MSALERYGLSPDPVIEYYKKDVDRTLLREHLEYLRGAPGGLPFVLDEATVPASRPSIGVRSPLRRARC
jgi:hypothetical protein